MPEASNTHTGQQVASTLNAIPFDNLLGGPLAACVHAQAEAAQTTVDYIRQFAMTASGLDPEGSEPITVSFTFVMNGIRHVMTVPLMTIVPIPYMRIDHVDLSFTADITACDDSKMEARYALGAYQCANDNKQSASTQSKMGITIRAATTDMPAGMAKMLDFFNNNLIVQQTLTASDVSRLRQEIAEEQTERQALEQKRRRLLAALVQAVGQKAQKKENKEESEKNEELKKKEEELKIKEEELKKSENLLKQKESEQKIKEEELKKSENLLKQKENEQKQKENEQKTKEAELKKKEEEQKNNENQLKQKESEQKTKEAELKKKEEELKKLQVSSNKILSNKDKQIISSKLTNGKISRVPRIKNSDNK